MKNVKFTIFDSDKQSIRLGYNTTQARVSYCLNTRIYCYKRERAKFTCKSLLQQLFILTRETSHKDSKRASLLICEVYILCKIVQKQWSTCYKTKVWTGFGRVRVRTEIGQQYYYQSITGKGHVTWKSYKMMSQAQKGL